MKKKIYIGAFILSVVLYKAPAGVVSVPPFLPSYYSSVFNVEQKPLLYIEQRQTNGVDQSLYASEDEKIILSVENIQCDTPRCRAIFNNLLGYVNRLIGNNRGQFLEITQTELNAEVTESNVTKSIFAYMLPTAVDIWTFSATLTNGGYIGAKFKEIGNLVDRQRYEEAWSEGNVSMGHWGKQIHRYEKQLFQAGKRDDAIIVLRNLLTTSPYNYQAHLDFVENTTDLISASNSAGIVFKNAENYDLIDKAARFLKNEPKTVGMFPVLSTNETGFQVILIPIPPCNAWLLEDAAKTYERITDIPVKIRRINDSWKWASPERIARQRDVQNILVRLAQGNVDFWGWTRDRYIDSLAQGVESEDALSKYYIKDLIDTIEKEPGQYFIDPHLQRFCDILKKYRSKDIRTMYVGITEVNIYSGDNNYVFSLGKINQESSASILSYYMMLGDTLGEEYQSRNRLVERIAKELVPASLKLLGIPRSTDPTCPYSYSSGIDRLDQKTLVLSSPIKEALEKIKNTASNTPVE